MKKKTVNLTATITTLISIFASIALAGATLDQSKTFTLKPGESGYMKIDGPGIPGQSKVNVTAKADRGNVRITVTKGNGKRVAKGKNRLSFTMGKEKTTYKITFTNKTKMTQRVEASAINSYPE